MRASAKWVPLYKQKRMVNNNACYQYFTKFIQLKTILIFVVKSKSV